MRLEGKIALITGAGSGIGQTMALRFARGGAAQALQADVSQSTQVRAALEAVAARWGRLHVLCNNAGVYWSHRGDTLVTEMEEDVWDQVLAINLKSVYLCSKFAIPLMTAGGSIVNM